MSKINRCRSCGSKDLLEILDLGNTPLANSLLKEEELSLPEYSAPLNLVFCDGCALVQITETVPPETLFRHYLYLSSFSDGVLQNAKAISDQLIPTRQLGQDSLVVEIASNDGYLLKYYGDAGIRVLGIEPALNIAETARRAGIETISEFFSTKLAKELVAQGKNADVVHANNVLAHVSDLNGVVEGIRIILKENGIASIEVPYLKDLIDQLEFDTIYHEHLCYFSAHSLLKVMDRNGLVVLDVDRLPIHGGSLRVFVGRSGSPSERVRELLTEEKDIGMNKIDYFRAFSDRVNDLRRNLKSMLTGLKENEMRIAAYGASAKGSTLLNFCGIGRETLDFVVDRSTVKQGFYTPGTHLRIYETEKLLRDKPDYVLLLSWNHAREVIEQQSEYLRQGGKFIVPVPNPSIVAQRHPELPRTIA